MHYPYLQEPAEIFQRWGYQQSTETSSHKCKKKGNEVEDNDDDDVDDDDDDSGGGRRIASTGR